LSLSRRPSRRVFRLSRKFPVAADTADEGEVQEFESFQFLEIVQGERTKR